MVDDPFGNSRRRPDWPRPSGTRLNQRRILNGSPDPDAAGDTPSETEMAKNNAKASALLFGSHDLLLANNPGRFVVSLLLDSIQQSRELSKSDEERANLDVAEEKLRAYLDNLDTSSGGEPGPD